MKSFLFAADLDPCRNIKCKFYGKCKATGPSSAVCTCDYPCPAYDELVCDSRGVTFANLCEYQKEVCRMKKEPPIAHAGGCRGWYYISIISNKLLYGNLLRIYLGLRKSEKFLF